MESGIKSSFIPHEVSGGGATGRSTPTGMADLLALAATVIFVASVALAIGVFLYVQFLRAESASKLDQLERAKAAFEPSLIEELGRLDDRMHAASDILTSHSAPSAIFSVLEQVTLQSVWFQSLEFQAADQKLMSLSMRGVASSMNAVALQADLLNKSGVVVNPIFSNISRGDGGVRFDVKADINPTSVRFEQIMNAAAASAAIPDDIELQSPFTPQGGSEPAPAESGE